MSKRMEVAAKVTEVKNSNSISRLRKIGIPNIMKSTTYKALFLQRTAGNKAVQKLIESGALQDKLTVGELQDHVQLTQGQNGYLIIQDVLNSRGQPMDHATRSFMELRFGHDFSHVRLHTDAKANEAVKAVNARAFTVGSKIVLGEGEYVPDTLDGRRLLSHELTHVIQQQKSNHFSSSSILQRMVKYIQQITGDEAKLFLEKFDLSLKEIDDFFKKNNNKKSKEFIEAIKRLKTLRETNKVTCWQTAGGLYYASYDNSSGELRLHINFKAATSPWVLVHEAIHALHAARYPKLSQMYGKALETGEELNENKAILLLKFKAWTEYWAYYRTVEYKNMKLAAEFPKETPLEKPHEEAIGESDVKASRAKVKELTGEDFNPWEWEPPAFYKAKVGKQSK